MEHTLLERDQCLARENQSRKEIAKLLEQRKNGENTISLRVIKAVDEVKDRLQARITSLEAELGSLTKQLAESQSNLERLTREKKAVSNEFDKVNELGMFLSVSPCHA